MRYIVEISYIASDKFSGWQVQKNANTYQAECEKVFEKVLGEKVSLVASGRTDAGVSAVKQVAHFDCMVKLPLNFVGRCNSLLPDEIKILSARLANADFHARFSAKRKTYIYNFYVSNIKIPYYDVFATQVKGNFDLNIAQQNLKQLLGEHNFKCFCASGSGVDDYVRKIYNVSLTQNGCLFTFKITGNGFLYNMVRIIVGTLIDISSGKNLQSVKDIISSEDRTKAGKTAPAKGLTLLNVEYD